MGDKLLGYVVWRGAKWYLRRRYGGVGPKLALAGAGLIVAGGVATLVAQRRAKSG